MKILVIFFIFILLVSYPVYAGLLINEIMYNPLGNDDNNEWIEVYNHGEDNVDMEGWRLFENNANHRLDLFQGEDMVVPLGGYVLIAEDAETFMQNHRNYEGMVFDSSFSLNNGGEYIALRNQEGNLIDEVNYVVNQGREGFSLELITPNFDNNIQRNWDQSLEEGGTPGVQNSIYEEPSIYSNILDGNLWNFISFNIEFINNRSGDVFSSLDNLVVVKDGYGNFYQPGNEESTLREIDIRNSYYVKIDGEDDTLELEGFSPRLENFWFNFREGTWTWFGYLLDEPMQVEEIFNEHSEDIFLVKDEDGRFWAPGFNFNNLFNLVPGKGYMMLPLNSFNFNYAGERSFLYRVAFP